METLLLLAILAIMTQVLAHLHWLVLTPTPKRAKIRFQIVHQILGITNWPLFLFETVGLRWKWHGAITMMTWLATIVLCSTLWPFRDDGMLLGIMVFIFLTMCWWIAAAFIIGIIQTIKCPDLLWM